MKALITQLFLLAVVSPLLMGQNSVIIADVNFNLNNNLVVVEYNLMNALPDEKFTIGLKFFTENNEQIIPKTLSGDVGKNIKPGDGKSISWDFAADHFEFSGFLKAVVSVEPSGVHTHGPEYALLSVPVPGLGGFFVEENKVRPILTTVSTLGLLSYGLSGKIKSTNYYNDYTSATDIDEILQLYDKANKAHHTYYIATRMAVALWITDITLVAIKGYRNKKENMSGTGFIMNYSNNQMYLGYRLTF
jgi:hypothetical protein